ncbi:MAG: tetratricopeptide repeat protein [Spirochaetes bacterium]|nr:tetratricopeptide repeat protein [Spirochaetota bacterium]
MKYEKYNSFLYYLFFIIIIFIILFTFDSCKLYSNYTKIDSTYVEKAGKEFPEYNSSIAYDDPFEFLTAEDIYQMILDTAISMYRQALNNTDFDLLQKSGEYFFYVYARTGSDLAKEYLLKIRDFKEKKLKEYINLAKNYEKKKDLLTAAIFWGRVLKLDKNNKEAKEFFNKNRDLIKKEIDKYLVNSENLISKNKFSDADKLLQTVLLLDPENIKAKELLNKIDEEKKKLAEANFKRGVDAFNKKDYENARKFFKQALDYGYNKNKVNEYIVKIDIILNAEKLYQSVLDFMKKEDYFNAAKSAQELMKLDSSYKDIKELYQKIKDKIASKIEEMYGKAVDLFNQKMYQEALDLFKQISQYDPNYKDIEDYIEACKAKIEALTGQG